MGIFICYSFELLGFSFSAMSMSDSFDGRVFELGVFGIREDYRGGDRISDLTFRLSLKIN